MITGLEALSLFSFAVWIWLAGLRGGFWRLREWLPEGLTPTPVPAVAVLIPARNEAETVGAAVKSMLAQNYQGAVTVTVIDDESTDGTADAARDAAVGTEGERLRIITGTPPREGWTGKLWALDQGLAKLPSMHRVPYVLFIDADTVHGPETLSRLVAKAQAEGRDLVSLMVRLSCESRWERLLIPAFVFFFRMLYPFARVNGTGPVAAAAGGCVLIRREALKSSGGLGVIRGAVIDDCALAAAIKRTGGRLWLGLSRESTSLRRYAHLGEAWDMVRRSAFTQLRHSILALLVTLFGLAVVIVAPPLVFVSWPLHNDILAALVAGSAWVLMAAVYLPSIRFYGLGPAYALALPLAAALFGLMTLDSARVHWQGDGARWKDRSYP